jgi:hypothetical protein
VARENRLREKTNDAKNTRPRSHRRAGRLFFPGIKKKEQPAWTAPVALLLQRTQLMIV